MTHEIKTTTGEILDVLGGELSGNYVQDLEFAQINYNSTFTLQLYEQAIREHTQQHIV